MMRDLEWDRFRQWERLQYAARKRLRNLHRQKAPDPREAERAIDLVAQHYRQRASQLVGMSRKRQTVMARHVAIHLIRRRTSLTLMEIGVIFGRRHSTIACLLTQFETMLVRSDTLRTEVNELSRLLEE